MATKRIIDQPTDTALSPGDLIIVDSEESGVGTRKFDLGQKLEWIDSDITDIKSDLNNIEVTEIFVQDNTLVINTHFINGNEVSY